MSEELIDQTINELGREDTTPAAVAKQVEETMRRDEEEAVSSQYDPGYGHFGNGLTVWNRLEEVDGDYKTIAHIVPDRTVTFYDTDLPELIQAQVERVAATTEMTISATQVAPVFSAPAQPEPEAVPSVPEVSAEQSPITLYRETLSTLTDVVRQSNFYGHLRDWNPDYGSAKDELSTECCL